MLWNSTTWLCICKRVYIGYACCQIHLNINKYVLNFTFTNWLPMDILLPKIWLSKITPPVPSPGKVLDPGMMLNPSPIWDFFFIVPASIKTAYLFSRLAPNIPICNFHSHFRALAIGYPVFWYNCYSKHRKASSFTCSKTLFWVSYKVLIIEKQSYVTCFRRVVSLISAMLAT